VARERENGHNYLCAYIIAHEKFSLPKLREHLAQHLPYYMIPSYFLQLEKIPLTPSGKVDREALPDPDLIALADNAAPQDMVEEKLIHIWAEILKIEKEKISTDSGFFDLGGNSFLAMRLQTKIQKKFYIIFPVIEIFKFPTIRKLAEYIKTSKKVGFTIIPPAEEKEYYPLTLAQQGLYLHLQLELTSTAYNIPSITQLDGELNRRKLETTFQKLLEQHESLRTSFEIINGFPVQRIHRVVDFALEYYETPSNPDDIIRDFIRPFDLTNAPLLHGGVIKNDKLKHILMLDVHHLITDGVSQDLLMNDIMALYNGKNLPRQKIRYRDFSEWQNNEEERKRKQQDEDYWREQFDGNTPALKLPIDYTRPALQSFAGGTVTFEIGPEETAKLKLLAQEEDATLFMVLLAIYNILLAKLSRQEDITVGTPTAGRPHIDLEPVVGMFVITLPIRNFPTRGKTFQAFLNEVKKNALAAFKHQACDIENLVKQIRTFDTSRDRLFDVLFTFQNMKTSTDETKHATIGLLMKPYSFKNTSAKFDLNFVTVEMADRLFIAVEYCSKIFKEETIREFTKYFAAVVSIILENKNIVLENIEISSDLKEVAVQLPETGFFF
ncbi:MAG: condensation domain-containing protein, partial [Acidobacteria bacterium]|nr:condensation domain-containing protein [Acidobacteriota bacterium]